MNDGEMRSTIVQALHKTANVFSNPSVSQRLQDPEAHVALDELGLDSLDRTEWCIEIESATGMVVNPGEIADFNNMSDLAHHLAERHTNSAA